MKKLHLFFALIIGLFLYKAGFAETAYTFGVASNTWQSNTSSHDVNKSYKKLLKSLSQKTRSDFKLVYFKSNTDLKSAIENQKIDFAFIGRQLYTEVSKTHSYPIVATMLTWDDTNKQNKSTSDIYLVTNQSVKSFSELKGSTLILGNKLSTSLYALPMSYFKKQHIDVKDFFKNIVYIDKQADIINKLQSTSGATVAAVWAPVFWSWGNNLENATVVARISGIKNPVVIAAQTLPASVMQSVGQALATFDAKQLKFINATGFTTTE